MGDRLFAISDRLHRADEHLDVIKAMVRTYFESDRCTYTGEFDPKQDTHHISGNVEFPEVRLATLVGEVVHNLRSVLDHLANQLVVENEGTPTKNTRWPIRDEARPKDKRGRVPPPHVAGGVSDVARALITRTQPYAEAFGPDGAHHHALWQLHQMWNIDKHAKIAIHGVHLGQITFGGGQPIPPFTWHSELVRASEYEAELRFVADDAAVDVEGSGSVYVVIHEPPGAEGSLMTTLMQARDKVWAIVAEAQATCFAPDHVGSPILGEPWNDGWPP
jgi:hypothetical protein